MKAITAFLLLISVLIAGAKTNRVERITNATEILQKTMVGGVPIYSKIARENNPQTAIRIYDQGIWVDGVKYTNVAIAPSAHTPPEQWPGYIPPPPVEAPLPKDRPYDRETYELDLWQKRLTIEQYKREIRETRRDRYYYPRYYPNYYY